MKSSIFGFSEDEMANAFRKVVLSPNGLPGIGVFGSVYREISCRQGRPDFIAFSKQYRKRSSNMNSNIKSLDIRILSLLKPLSPRTTKYIAAKINCPLITIKNVFKKLKKKQLVRQTKTGSYILNKTLGPSNNELTVFELKLNNPKRAIFQAQQSKNYASRTIIVVPPGQDKNYKKFTNTLSRWGIGLAVFDPLNKTFNLVRRPRKSKPLSNYDYINTLLQISKT